MSRNFFKIDLKSRVNILEIINKLKVESENDTIYADLMPNDLDPTASGYEFEIYPVILKQ